MRVKRFSSKIPNLKNRGENREKILFNSGFEGVIYFSVREQVLIIRKVSLFLNGFP